MLMIILLLATLFQITLSSSGERAVFSTSTSDLANLLKTDHFIDKTDIVKVFLQSTRMIMVSTPRRFGKSTNLDIIKRFCEITVDAKGNRVQLNLTENYKLFTTYSLNIYKHDRAFFFNNFGMYPVIYLDFKNLYGISYDTFLHSFIIMIEEVFWSHKYLLSSSMLRKTQITKFDKFYHSFDNSNLSETDLLDSLHFLSELLFTHFNRTKCIVLIDEYDGPVQEAIFHTQNLNAISQLNLILDFIRKFISNTLKSNIYVDRALIIACVRLVGVTTTDANNIKRIPFLTDNKFSKLYGFSEEEVKLLLKKHKMLDKFVNVKKWYAGYYARNINITIYNPISIVKFLCYKRYESYWVKTGSVPKLEEIFVIKKIRKKMEDLLSNNVTTITLLDKIDINQIVKLNEIVHKPECVNLNTKDVSLFMELMADLGYFNIVYREYDDVNSEVVAHLKIPNKEIYQEIDKCLFPRSLNTEE